MPFYVGEHIHKLRKVENFYLSSTHGAQASSLFSKWLVCSHMQQCRAYDVFIVLLTPCKPVFLCCFKQPRFLFSCYLQNSHRVNSSLLLGSATLTSAFFCFFFNALWDSCSVVFRENMEKPFGSYLSPHRMKKCCPQFHATCNPPFAALGPVSVEVPSSLSNIIFSLNLICIFLFFQNGLQMMFCITQFRRTLNARMYSWPLSLTRNILS